jgi:TolA-binding protein
MRKEIVMLRRGVYSWSICAICLFVVSAPLFAQDQADSLYADAKAIESQGKREEAKAAYQQIIEQYPNSPVAKDAGLRLSRCNALEFLAAGNDAAAQLEIANAEKNFANHPDLPWFLCRIASEYETLRKHDQARSLYEQVFRQYPDSPAAKNARLELVRYEVLSLAVAGKDAEVQSEIAKAKTEFAGRRELPVFLYSIANQYKKQKRPDRAKDLFGQIIREYPNKPVARGAELQLLGYKIQSLVAAGEDAEIQFEIERAKADLDSPAGDVIFLIGVDYYLKAEEAAKAGDPNQAKVDYQKALNLWKQFEQAIPNHSRPQYTYFSGIVCQRLGQYGQAVDYFQQVTTKWPDYIHGWNAQYFIGYCYEELAKVKDIDPNRVAKDEYIDPNHVDTLIEEAYNKTIEKYPNGGLTRLAYLSLGDLCLRQKRYTDAISYYELYQVKANHNDPFQDRTKWDLAWLYDKIGDIPKSRAMYEQIIPTSDSSKRQWIIDRDLRRRNQQGD